jgi:Prokaryotic Cytochrome C oxidase subunit IV
MDANYPSKRSLLIAWLALMTLSLGTMLAGRVTGTQALGPLFVAALFAITWFKATWILRHFLNLRASTKGWNMAFAGYLLVLLVIIFCIYLFTWMN